MLFGEQFRHLGLLVEWELYTQVEPWTIAHSFNKHVFEPLPSGGCVREGGSTKESWCKSSWRAGGHQAGSLATHVGLLSPHAQQSRSSCSLWKSGCSLLQVLCWHQPRLHLCPIVLICKRTEVHRGPSGTFQPVDPHPTNRPWPVRRRGVPQPSHGCQSQPPTPLRLQILCSWVSPTRSSLVTLPGLQSLGFHVASPCSFSSTLPLISDL